jgi:hypothetical protein
MLYFKTDKVSLILFKNPEVIHDFAALDVKIDVKFHS